MIHQPLRRAAGAVSSAGMALLAGAALVLASAVVAPACRCRRRQVA
ncbi:hypothetical protein [Pseudarthrobacter sp. AG30]|nr:hypothetical protein [Pseudarthrobacter sp. AG30]